MSKLDDNIKALTLARFGSHRFESEEWYRFLEENLDDGALLVDRSTIIRDKARKIARTWRDNHGRRMFENIPVVDAAGEVKHEWGQPRLFDFNEAIACVEQTAKGGERICRKANALARRFRDEKHFDIPIPFPHLDEEAVEAGN